MDNGMKKNKIMPPEEIIIEPVSGWFKLNLKELWDFRELLVFFIWRDIAVRYKQTVLGAAWAIIQPVMTMVIFSIIFGRLARLPSDGIPYPIFSYTALLPWQLFSSGLTAATSSVVSNQNMITKTHFPRLVLPISGVLSGLVDFGLAFLILLGMMVFYHISFTWRIVILPAFILLALLTALAAGLWLAVFNVRFRDVRLLTSFLMQFWQYATPVAYSISLIPQKWRTLYGLNPMTGVIGGFRWAMLGQTYDLGPLLIVSILVVLLLLFGGIVYFQRMEKNFADMV
jgi:lipopolysaccharide transport system permease protein